MDRHPGSWIRPEKLKDIIHRWQVGAPQCRLRFEVEWKGKNLSATEITASGSAMLFGAPDWATNATALNLMINTAALKADRQSADIVNIGTFCLSFHAIGRYFQRQPDRGEAALLQDLALFSRITVRTNAPEQAARYPTEGGAWGGGWRFAGQGGEHRTNGTPGGTVHPNMAPGVSLTVAALMACASLLYATAGQAGGTAFLAIMAFWGFPPPRCVLPHYC